MNSILQYIQPVALTRAFSTKEERKLFSEWDRPLRQDQVFLMTFLTALLYIVFSFIDKPWVPVSVQGLMLKFHLFVAVPPLLIISFMAYKRKFYNFMMFALAMHPLIAMIVHVYIISLLVDPFPIQTEAYFCVIWIYIMSGLTFKYAIASASATSIILLIAAYFRIDQIDAYLNYSFWVFCSFLFGFFGAIIFDRYKKIIYLSEKKLKHMANTDSLTGAFNRNHLNTVLTQEIGRGVRYKNSFGVLIIDVDHFKNINDTFGHNMGDMVLKKIAKALADSIRENDILVRWGGEEFVVVLLEVDEQCLMTLGDKLREEIKRESYDIPSDITVSVGASMFKIDDTQDSLLNRADRALFRAKEKGRDETVLL